MKYIQWFSFVLMLLFFDHAAATQPNVEYVSCVVFSSPACSSSPNSSIAGGNFTGVQVISAAGYYVPGDNGGGMFTVGSGSCALTPKGTLGTASNLITNVTSLAGIATGMVVQGTNIPNTPPTTVTGFGNNIGNSNANFITISASVTGTRETLTLDGNNGGTTVLDSVGNCFHRVGGDTSILNFGARGDAVSPGFAVIPAGSNSFSAPSNSPNVPTTNDIGKSIVIAGAGAPSSTGPATFASTIYNVTTSMGTTTIFFPPGVTTSTTTPTWYAVSFSGLDLANTGTYVVGQTITLESSDIPPLPVGTAVVLTVDSSSHVLTAAVTHQVGAVTAMGAAPANPAIDMSGGGAKIDLNYNQTGTYWYGSDDSSAINNALNSAPANTDVYVPANRAFGFANPIVLPQGNNSLRGENQESSLLVALAAMSGNPSNSGDMCGSIACTYAILYPNVPTGGSGAAAGGQGGGMRDLSIDAFMLANYTVGDLSGQNQSWLRVTSTNGTIAHFLYGNNGGGQITNILFDHLHGKTETSEFPIAAQIPPYSFTTKANGTGAVISNSHFENAFQLIGDEQIGHNLYIGDRMTGTPPFTAQDCIDAEGQITIISPWCDDASRSAVFIGNGQVNATDVYARRPNSLATSSSYGVLLESGVDRVQVTGVNVGTNSPADVNDFVSSPANVVAVASPGALGPNTIINDNPGANLVALGAAAATPRPQGRLTLIENSPVMTADAPGVSKIWYAPFAGNQVPVFNGQSVVEYTFTSGANDPTGQKLVLNPTDHIASTLYDLFEGLNGGNLTLCSGPAWSSATNRSASLIINYGLQTNGVTNMSCFYNDGAHTGMLSCPQYQCTYLGTFATIATAGETSVTMQPNGVSGGQGNFVGLWNAYNLVPLISVSIDSNGSWPGTGLAWRAADGSNANSITFVDGLGQTPIRARENVSAKGATTAVPTVGIVLDSTTAAPLQQSRNGLSGTISLEAEFAQLPMQGRHYAQAMESSPTTGTFSGPLQLLLDWQM